MIVAIEEGHEEKAVRILKKRNFLLPGNNQGKLQASEAHK